MKQIEAVIFDWAGTMVDYGSMAPVHAMRQAFSQYKLDVLLDEIRQPMGMLKLDHIKTILNMERISHDFRKQHGKEHDTVDIEKIYIAFEKNIFSVLHNHTTLIPGALAVQDYLRHKQIKIGSTTGYTKEMIHVVAEQAQSQGYFPDLIVSSDEVKRGRPYPYMLQRNLSELEVQDVRSVVKIGDTIVDIQEGRNAGCWSVGVIKGGSMLGLNQEEIENTSPTELQEKIRKVKYAMLAAGADYVIDSIDELPFLIDALQQKLRVTYE